MRFHGLAWSVTGLVVVALAVAAAKAQEAPAPAPAAPADDQVVDTSYDAPDGTRVLRQSIVVPATPAEVWATWTTAEGWKRFAVPVAFVDFRVGGIIETSYRADATAGDPANIKNRVLSFLPLRMLSFQAVQAPPGFANPELLADLWSVAEFEELGERRVRVTVNGVGYRPGTGHDRLLRFFTQGNAWTLRKLRERFVTGPIDWAAERGGVHGGK